MDGLDSPFSVSSPDSKTRLADAIRAAVAAAFPGVDGFEVELDRAVAGLGKRMAYGLGE